ncbi:MAG: protein TolQ [Candidatus Aquirickettsiella gammari]|jgi:biopolymer transport protein TolQ|uniref:Tol-Pal system protein TolQ n=1 Tax=Candidatus Aquirickettsiella gammari TaxID=2016198 RepID=A0A370CJB3_9COXI|nr:MAG: protein TolQ [Candidatus Aquirickettsiella gammari]
MPTLDPALWSYFYSASGIVKFVMLILLLASIVSWSMILQRGFLLRRTRKLLAAFEKRFWSGIDLSKLYADLNRREDEQEGLACIFYAGFREFVRLHQQVGNVPVIIMEGVQRAMRIAYSQQHQQLEKHLDFLATLGSTSPYIGLFGTVWGIMTSFQALSASQQTATIAMVAPGISEALVATAMGLFVAIPAVIFYNRYSNQNQHLLHSYHRFQEEFSNILYRQIHGGTASHVS